MRITGGKYRSRQVKMPPGVIRPAMDRMRESMFGVHCSYYGNLEGLTFLDLFSGSGSVALEAASRGCSSIVLVEKDSKKKPTILENLAIAKDVKSRLYLLSVEKFIHQNIDKRDRFDLIHLDPPFPLPDKFSYIKEIARYKFLAQGGTLTIHYPEEERPPDIIGDLACVDVRSYGQSQLAFYRRTASPE